MRGTLLDSLRNIAKKMPSVVEYKSDSTALCEELCTKYFAKRDAVWPWSEMRATYRTISYAERDVFGLLETWFKADESALLYVSDEKPAPWPVFEGKAHDLLGLVKEQPFFEYILTPVSQDGMVFDTHHNTLVVAGSLIERLDL